jgi:PAS domain S-box-containing protein
LQGWKWTAFIHPEDVEGIVEKWRACLASGEPFLHEARVLRADGEYRWMLHHKVAARDGCGQIVKWYGSSIDIEDRKRAERQLRRRTEELQRSEFYLAEGQRLAHMGSWAFDPAGFDYWSPELFRMHGLVPDRKPPTIQEYLDCVHPHDRESMANLIKGLWAKASPFDATKRIVRPNGEVRYIRFVGAPVVENESLKKYVGSAIDVTEHELVTQELRCREAYLAEAQRLSHTGSFGWKPDSGEIVWSDETYRIFEYDNTLTPTIDSVVQRVHPQDRALAQPVIDRASQTGTAFEHEYRLLMADGRVKHVHAVAHAVKNASGDREFIGAVTDVTERKTTEDKIRRLVDADILGICIANVEGEIVEPNQAFLQMLQYSQKDLVSGRLRWTDLTPTEFRERDERALTEVLATGVFQPYEKELFRKDGRRVPVLIGGALFQGANEGVVFVLDLSEQKRAEEALRRSESYLAEAQRLSQTGSWAWSPEQDIKYWSEECYRVLSFDPQDGLPRFEDFVQRLHPDDQPGFRELIQTVMREKAEWETDYRIVHPNGTVRDIHVIGHPVLTTSGHLTEFVGTVIDITERKRAEQELQQLVDFVPQLIVVLDSDGKRIHTNRVFREYTGLTLEELRSGEAVASLIHPDDLERMRAARDRGIATGEPFELDTRLRGKDGIYRWFLAQYNPLVEEGRARRWYLSATEIESRKQEEERIKQENVRLEERTRIAQELHDTLLQTLQSVSLHLGAAVLSVAQDSPLKNEFDWILEIMGQGIVESRDAIQGLRSSGSQTSDLVGALSRIQDELKVQPDIDFRVTVTGRQRQLAREIQNEIYRIGREALANAFCHSGAERIELELEYSDKELLVRIRDNGCGIDPRMLEKGRDGHWGLAGMRERATRIGGLFKILSSPASGTEVQLSIPTSLASELVLPYHSSG